VATTVQPSRHSDTRELANIHPIGLVITLRLLSVGFPPSANGGCPLGRASKEPALHLKSLEISWDWEVPGASPKGLKCEWPDVFFGNIVQGYKPVTVSCYSDWAPVIKGGRYFINIVGVNADVKDDSDPPKQLQPVRQPWFERAGQFFWENVKA
jgi:hypothetical protein